MSDPIPLLRAVPNQPVPEIIEAAERMLAMAKSGELQGMAIARRHADGSFSTFYASALGIGHDFALHTGVARLAFRYQAEAFEETERDGMPDGPA